MPPTEDGKRPYRIELVAVDARTGQPLVSRTGEDALVWPDCLSLLARPKRDALVTAVARHFALALSSDARIGRHSDETTGVGVPTEARVPFETTFDSGHRHRLYQLLVRLDGALRDAGATYFLTGGGLLGSLRYGDLLPWDDDLDLAVVGHLDLADLEVRVPELLVVRTDSGRATVSRRTGGPKIDLHFVGATVGDRLQLAAPGDSAAKFVPAALCLPPVRGKLGIVETNLPADADGWAAFVFGPSAVTIALPPRPHPPLGVPIKDLPPPPAPLPRYEWVSVSRFAADCATLAGLVPPDVTAVAGIPRSGMGPAALIATQLQLPLYELTESGRLHRLGAGSRGTPWRKSGDPAGRVFVVDDAIYSGGSLTRARNALDRLNRPAVFGAVYARSEADHVADVFARTLDCPQLMEWNLFNNGCVVGRTSMPQFAKGVASDLDGIIRHDSASGGVPGTPYLVPRLHPLPLIVTGQPESARATTEGWLKQWGVKWSVLRMMPDSVPPTPSAVARHKADHYGASELGFFVESCPNQAALIHRWTRKPVICPRANLVFALTKPGPDRLPHLLHTPRCDGYVPSEEPDYWPTLNSAAGLLELVNHVGPLRRMAEVGSYRGVSSELFAVHVPEVLCVDAWIAPMWAVGLTDLECVANEYPGVRVVHKRSHEAAAEVPDRSLDLVYIDASHEYESVAADIAAWLPKVRRGGWLAGHDYHEAVSHGGVVRAVREAFGSPEKVFSDTSWVVRVAN